MGYANTSIVAYGVKISENIAKQIYEQEFDKKEGMFKYDKLFDGIYFRKLPMSQIDGRQQLLPVTPYKQHGEGTDSFVFYPKMWANEADSRMGSLIYQPMHQHFLGIYIASNGYAYNDKILPFIRNPPKEAIKNFQSSIKPLMSKHKILEVPDVIMINQIW